MSGLDNFPTVLHQIISPKTVDSFGGEEVKKINTKHKNGTISELLAEQFFIEQGNIVSKPINDFSEYDFVIDIQPLSKLQRVQVKTIYFDNTKRRWISSLVTSHIRGNGRRENKKYSIKSFDIGAFVCKEHNAIYIIPIDKLEGRRSITFYPDGKPETVNSRYKDYEYYKHELLQISR